MRKAARRRWVLLITVPALLALPACGGGSDGGKADSEPERKKVRTFEGAFSGRVRADGTVPRQLALDVFASVYGAIPGIETSTLVTKGLRSGTLAINAIRPYLDTLTKEQRASVAARLPGGTVRAPEPGGPGRSVHAGSPRLRELKAMADAAAAEISGHLGRPFDAEIEIEEMPSETVEGEEIFADTTMSVDAPYVCFIRFTPEGMAQTGADLESTVAHEVFHCFQYLASDRDDVPPWIDEGSAEWVGETIAGGSSSSARSWNEWLGVTGSSLFRRSYSAIGFYAVLDEQGIDPWGVVLPMLEAPTSATAFRLASGGADEELLDSIGRSLVREDRLGAQWESRGPGITSLDSSHSIEITPVITRRHAEAAHTDRCGLGCAGFKTLQSNTTLEPYGTAAADLAVAGAVFQVVSTAPQGVLGFDDGTEVDLPTGAVVSMCLLAGGCVCEDGSEPLSGAPLHQKPDGLMGLEVASTRRARVELHFAALTLDEACVEGTGMDECLLGTWTLDVPRLQDTLQERFFENEAALTASGDGHITFKSSSYDADLNILLSALTEVSGVGGVKADVRITGSGNTKYRSNGFLVLASEPETVFVANVQVTVGGRVVDSVPLDLGIEGIGDDLFSSDISYYCPTAGRLVMTPPDGYPVAFVREE